MVSEGAPAGESQRIEGASGELSGSCASNRKSGLRKAQRAGGVMTFLPPLPGPGCRMDAMFVDSLTSRGHSAQSTVPTGAGMAHGKHRA